MPKRTWSREQLRELFNLGIQRDFVKLPDETIKELSQKWDKTENAVKMRYHRIKQEYKKWRAGEPVKYGSLPITPKMEPVGDISQKLVYITEQILNLGQDIEAIKNEVREMERWMNYTAEVAKKFNFKAKNA